MSDGVTGWALLVSVALHIAVIALGLTVPRMVGQPKWFGDFWAGETFEVPDSPTDTGEGDTPSDPDDSAREINVDGLDVSTPARTLDRPVDPGEGAAQPTPPRARASARTTLSSTAPAAAHGSGPGGTFGGEGSAPGVRDLLRSFVRTVPIIASSDQVWSSLPLGAAGSAEVTLVLDDDGKPRLAGGVAAPAHLRRLILKTVSVMSGGRFGISSTEGIASEQRLHVAVTLTQQAAPTQDQAVTGGVFALRFEPPDEHNVSHAFFTLASGRRVEVAVRPLKK
jgi:hypothetical protein